MSPQKVYTIGVSNKFAGLGYESSSDEEGGKKVPKVTKEKKKDSKGVNANTLGGTSVSVPHSSPHGLNISKENRSPDGRMAGRNDRYRSNDYYEARLHNNDTGGESRMFRGGRGGAGRGAFRGGRGGIRGGHRGGRLENENELANGFAGENINGVEGSMSPQKAARGIRRGGRASVDGGWSGRGRRGFDRHSNTGRGVEMKKEGGGGHNWGNEEPDWGCDNGEKSASQSLEIITSDAEAKKEGDENGDVDTNQPSTEDEKSLAPREPETLDLDAYKAEQAAKRANLPQSNKVPSGSAKITTIKDLESQGYTKHVKNSEDDEGGEETSDEEADSDEDDEKRKKTMNVYEYIYNEGGHVRLFPGRRGGRGGGGAGHANFGERPGGDKRNNRMWVNQYWAGKDAPDIRDERAFPKLG